MNDTLETHSSENTVTFRHARSYIPWPVLEHGVTPRLNRNEYYEYASTARNGQHLRLLWSVDSEKNATSLIQIDISSAARLNNPVRTFFRLILELAVVYIPIRYVPLRFLRLEEPYLKNRWFINAYFAESRLTRFLKWMIRLRKNREKLSAAETIPLLQI